MEKKVPSYSGTLRDHTLLLPFCISITPPTNGSLFAGIMDKYRGTL